MPRFDKLPGIGRVRVYDHGAKYADRYTILMEDWDVYDGTETTPHHGWLPESAFDWPIYLAARP